jgi:hypothetical protein
LNWMPMLVSLKSNEEAVSLLALARVGQSRI